MKKNGLQILLSIMGIIIVGIILLYIADVVGITGRAGGSGAPARKADKVSSPIPPAREGSTSEEDIVSTQIRAQEGAREGPGWLVSIIYLIVGKPATPAPPESKEPRKEEKDKNVGPGGPGVQYEGRKPPSGSPPR